MATQTVDLARVIRRLVDRAEIIDLESRKGRYADENRFDELGDVFADDAVALFRNGEMRLDGLEAMTQAGRESLSDFALVQHVITNVLVDLDGDTAKVRANVIATHVYDPADPASVWEVKGYYTDEAVRTPKGWRLSQVALHRIWERDTGPTPAGGR